MTEELLAYLLDDLPPERRAEVERNVAIDPAWRRELERLRACLDAGGDREQCGCQEEAPPEDLLTRTCFLVEHVSHCQEQSSTRLGASRPKRAAGVVHAVPAMSAAGASVAQTRPWSPWDAALAAGVLLALGALMTPALYETRATARRQTCDNNLKTLGTALFEYQLNHKKQLPPVLPNQNAAIFAVALRDGAGVTEEQLRQILVCPESQLAAAIAAGRIQFRMPPQEELRRASGERLAELLQKIPCSYAYRVGFYDVEDQYQQLPYTGDPQMPMLGDAPEVTPEGIRSANHGCGQNVLYECLGVKYRTNCLQPGGRDNFYLNQAGRHAAGLDEEDIVLMHPQRTPFGELLPVVDLR